MGNSTKFNGHYTRKCTANIREELVNEMTFSIVSNHTTFRMVTAYVDRQHFADRYEASCCIESVARLVLSDQKDREQFRRQVRGSEHYMQLFDLACRVRQVLKSSPKSNLNDWLYDYED